MLHLSIMIAWHDSGWNGKACKKPDENVYCESFRYTRRKKWKGNRLHWSAKVAFTDPNDAPCFFENAIFSFDPTRSFHLKSAAFGGLGVSEKEVENFIYPQVIEESSLVFLFCRENPLSDERIVVACVKPSVLKKGWFGHWPSIEAKIKPEDVIFVIPYQEIAESVGGYRSFPPEIVFEVPKGKQHLFRGMMSLIKLEDALSVLARAHEVLQELMEWANNHHFDTNLFGRQIAIQEYIERVDREIQSLGATQARYRGVMGLLWYLEAEATFKKYIEALQQGQEQEFVEDLRQALRNGVADSKVGLTQKNIQKLLDLNKGWKDFFLDYLVFYPLTRAQIKEIIQQFEAGQVIQNPYRLYEGFKVAYENLQPFCDPISLETIDQGEKKRLARNFDPLALERCRAILVEALRLGFKDGHTSVPEDMLIDKYFNKVMDDLSESKITFNELLEIVSLNAGFMSEEIIVEQEGGKRYFSLTKARKWDRSIEQKIKDLFKKTFTFNVSTDDIKNRLRKEGCPEGIAEEDYQKALEDQALAVATALQRGLTVITGPAGTGKTTVIKTIIELLRNRNSSAKVLLTAPTGKAAARLKQVVGIEALTIHRYLAKRGAFDFRFFELKPTREPEHFDLVVIDEASIYRNRKTSARRRSPSVTARGSRKAF